MILADTHIVAWMALEPSLLSPKAAAALRESAQRGGIAISCITLLELATLASRRRIVIPGSLDEFLEEIERRFIVVPIDHVIAKRATEFSPAYPRDPADRIIGASALVRGLRLVTRDEKIRMGKEVPTVW